MNIHLTPQLEALVRSKVESGLYNSASEVIREALRLLDEQERLREIRLEELRKALRTGVDQLDGGEGSPLDVEKVIERGRAKLAKQRTARR